MNTKDVVIDNLQDDVIKLLKKIVRQDKLVANLMEVLNEEPLGYRTEEEHRVLEDYSERCKQKMSEIFKQSLKDNINI